MSIKLYVTILLSLCSNLVQSAQRKTQNFQPDQLFFLDEDLPDQPTKRSPNSSCSDITKFNPPSPLRNDSFEQPPVIGLSRFSTSPIVAALLQKPTTKK